jgi:hypothetical protein
LAHGTEPPLSSQNSSEPRVPRHILVSVFSFLFGYFLSKLITPIDKTANAPHDHDTTNDYTQVRNDEGLKRINTTEMNGPQTAPQNHVSKKEPKHWWKKWKFWTIFVNVLTFFVITWYACEAHKSNVIAHNSLIATQRPWVGVSDVQFSDLRFQYFHSIPSRPSIIQMNLTTTYRIKNVGQSPAMNLSYCVAVLPTDTEKKTAITLICPPDVSHSTFLLPHDEVPAGQGVMTNPTRGGLFQKTTNIRVRIWITYEDRWGSPYSSEFIYSSHSPGGSSPIAIDPDDPFTYLPVDGWFLSKSDAK